MRINLTGALLCISLMQLSASTYAQKVTIKNKKITVEQLVREIRKQTNFDVLIPGSKMDLKERISVNVQDMSLPRLLDLILEGRSLTYTMGKDFVVVQPVERPITKTEQEGIPLELSGRIVDRNGKPIHNATVRIKGVPNVAILTSASGAFKIRMTADNQILSITHVGYQTKEVTLKKGQQTIEIVLEEAVRNMDDIVVNGISQVKKEVYTGSSATFSGEELRRMSSASILQGLGLLDPSFRIIENNALGSDPNAMPEIELRGSSTLNDKYPEGDLRTAFYGNPNLPLFILDGFETNLERIVDLDMNRIESVTLLKDGSAAAIYGTRSANGVVVIVTKAPVAGKLRTTYRVSANVVTPDLRDYNMLKAGELLDFEYRAGVYNGSSVAEHIVRQDLYNDRLAMVKSGVDTYWLSQAIRTAVEQRHSLGIEGGDQSFKYNVGVAASGNPGVMKGSSRNNYQGNVGIHYNVGKFLFRNDLQIANTKSEASPYGGFQSFVNAKPYFAIPGNNGADSPFLYENVSTSGQRSAYVLNPLYNGTINTQGKNQYTEIVNNFATEWQASSAFRFRGSFGFSKRFADSKDFRPATHTKFINITPAMETYALRGEMDVSTTRSTQYEGAVYAIYSKLFGQKHNLYTQVGGNIRESIANVDRVQAQGFPNPNMDDLAFAKQYMQNTRPGGLDNTNRLMGMLAMVNYAYDNRYYGDFSFKYDGSSQFGSNQKYAPIWSAGLGWNLHRESFIQSLGIFNSLRLTAALAETASQNFAPYQAMNKYLYMTDNIYDVDFGAILQGMGNADLKWQTTRQKKIALDMGLFRGRINITAEYYWKNTSNLLQSITLAPSTGFPSFTDNIGELTNDGFDVKLNVVVLNGMNNKPRLTIWGNIGANKNVISKISDAMKQRNQEILAAMQYTYDGDRLSTLPPNIFTEGASRSTIYALPSLGIDPVTGREVYQYRDGSVGTEWRAAELVAIADERPKFHGAVGMTFAYKGWDAVVAGSYSSGGYMYNQTLVDKVEDIDIREYNVDGRTLTDKWIRPGDEARYRAFSFVNGESRVGTTSRFVQKNSYFNISSVTLGYTLYNRETLKKLRLENLRLNVTLNDLMRFSTIEIERGTQYPFARRIAFGASVTF
ncbi:SusC/RagA family TonB-linked outer membrane protein [Sphingobacterium psychroaquaticum]|uniref:SusC/RagA family TonB-linked outer membrane protein n=1 Tax=Sphingobacterium psychroaquaticum TaxID=561061 RepID=UPI00141B660B|nr:SusC/RagA family TonB-linked outer membrane protein [Sphingobacterium psychroaquaticum]